MRGFGIVIAAAAFVVAAPAAAKLSSQQVAVEAAMTDSAAGWNAGDLERFMRIYSVAPDTSFVTKQGLVHGKAAMAARYRKNYDFDHPGARGVLTFATLDYRQLDLTHALYIGRYSLTGQDGKVQSGITSLVFRKESAGWRIIADHSS